MIMLRRLLKMIAVTAILALALAMYWNGRKDSFSPPEPPRISYERLDISDEYPYGLLIANLEGVEFRVPYDKYRPMRGLLLGFDVALWYRLDTQELVPQGRREHDQEYGVRMQFRSYRKPVPNYHEVFNRDYSKRPSSSDSTPYRLQDSKEYPGLKEYHLIELNKTFEYLIDYMDDGPRGRVQEHISCAPDFRELEKRWETPINGQCQFGKILSQHVTVRILFDSRILPQARDLESGISQLISTFTTAKQY